ncbi:MAG: AAA domain-containing protein, partial [Bacteroidota bacterium]|nr:AAA domain-containing protein [Bacteroidota bacterium]
DQIAKELNAENRYHSSLVSLETAKESISKVENIDAIVANAGVFGIFKLQKEPLIKDLIFLEENPIINISTRDGAGASIHQNSAITLDPSQKSVIDRLDKSDFIIEGPPGTGKSQSLTGLITNAMSNKMRVLVVCEKRTALDVLNERLSKLGLSDHIVIIEDAEADRRKIVDKVRHIEENLPIPNFNTTKFKELVSKFETQKAICNNYEENLKMSTIGDEVLSNTIASYLKYKRESKIVGLSDKIFQIDFKFNPSESNLIKDNLLGLNKQFHKTDINNDMLMTLDKEVFNNESPSEAWDNLSNQILTLVKKIDLELEKFEFFKADIKQKLKKELQLNVDKLTTTVEKIEKHFENAIQVKNAVPADKVFLAKLRILIDKNLKQVQEEKMQINNALYELQLQSKNEIINKFVNVPYQVNWSGIENVISELKRNTKELNSQLSELVADHHSSIINLENNSKWDAENFEIAQANQNALYKLVDEIIVSKKIIDPKVFHSDYKEEETAASLVAIKNLLVLLNKQEEHFREFMVWNVSHNKLTEDNKLIVNSLIELGSENWEIDFMNYYIRKYLSKLDKNQWPADYDHAFSLNNINEELTKWIIDQINHNWNVEKTQKIKQQNSTQSTVKAIFMKSSSQKRKKTTLRNIVRENFELFTHIFPVIMTNPVTCSTLFEMKQDIFDLVVFDEASQLNLQDTIPAFLRGKYKIVSGDSQQMPPSNYFGASIDVEIDEDEDDVEEVVDGAETDTNAKPTKSELDRILDSESLLDFSSKIGFESLMLRVHYRSQHPDLIQFSNYAFYGGNLIPMPAKNEYICIEYHNVGGYNVDTINIKEALKVVEYLVGLGKVSGEYPTVGIATFNLPQRAAINEAILEECQCNAEFNDKIQTLKSHPDEPMFVKNLENIQGDERDIIILSTTYGPKLSDKLDRKAYMESVKPKGKPRDVEFEKIEMKFKDKVKFSQGFGPINSTATGYRLFNVIITRAKHKMVVITSIPEEIISNYLSVLQVKKSNSGQAVFYTYLAYAKAVSNNNRDDVNRIVSDLARQSSGNLPNTKDVFDKLTFTESPFEEEVVRHLCNFLPSGRIVCQYEIGGFRIDIVILNESLTKPILAIECDGKRFHNSTEAYNWDVFRQKMLEGYGFKFYRIWSTNWWRNPEIETRKIQERIEEIESVMLFR